MDDAPGRGLRACHLQPSAGRATTSPRPPRPPLVLAARRAPYRGRSTPVNAWWGTFDLAVSLFSGQAADPPSNDFIMRNSATAQQIEVGWWPGDARYLTARLLRVRVPVARRIRPSHTLAGRCALGTPSWASTSSTGTTHAAHPTCAEPPSTSGSQRSDTPAWCAAGTRPSPPAPKEPCRPSPEAGLPTSTPWNATTSTPRRPVARRRHLGDAPDTTIVLVHGGRADSSGWNAQIATLQKHGYPVIAPANPLRGLESDPFTSVASSPQSRDPSCSSDTPTGAPVISNAAAGVPDVKALVYIAGFAPDAGESLWATRHDEPRQRDRSRETIPQARRPDASHPAAHRCRGPGVTRPDDFET